MFFSVPISASVSMYISIFMFRRHEHIQKEYFLYQIEQHRSDIGSVKYRNRPNCQYRVQSNIRIGDI
jgi:hypothetical protein